MLLSSSPQNTTLVRMCQATTTGHAHTCTRMLLLVGCSRAMVAGLGVGFFRSKQLFSVLQVQEGVCCISMTTCPHQTCCCCVAMHQQLHIFAHLRAGQVDACIHLAAGSLLCSEVSPPCSLSCCFSQSKLCVQLPRELRAGQQRYVHRMQAQVLLDLQHEELKQQKQQQQAIQLSEQTHVTWRSMSLAGQRTACALIPTNQSWTHQEAAAHKGLPMLS